MQGPGLTGLPSGGLKLPSSLPGPLGLATQGMEVRKKGGGVDYLICGAGGGGGCGYSYGGGAGGGGGVIQGSIPLLMPGVYPIVVGAPGAKVSNAQATNGGNSSAFGLTALGGGAGASQTNQYGVSTIGGSGGGAGNSSGSPGSPGTPGQGFAGGTAQAAMFATPYLGGGGGGAGGPAVPNTGQGGPGAMSAITGTLLDYGSGGAGGSNTSGTGLPGGPGGGPNGSDGVARGGGGGGIMADVTTISTSVGAVGCVIIRYLTGTLTCTGGAMFTVGPYTVHLFTRNGNFSVSSAVQFNFFNPGAVGLVTVGADGLTCTDTASGSPAGARAVRGRMQGKGYFEVALASVSGSSPYWNGFGSIGFGAGWNGYSNITSPSAPLWGFAYGGSSTISYNNAGSLANTMTPVTDVQTNGDILGFAIDANAGVAWVRNITQNPNAWNQNTVGPNPALGTGGLVVGNATSGAYFAQFYMSSGNAPVTIKFNFGQAAWAAPIPAGFSPF